MGIKYYHPLGPSYASANPHTYEGHGIGKIDFHAPSRDCKEYAMIDAKVAYCGTYDDGCTVCALECTSNGLGKTFYIRYLHGDYTVKTGDTVKAGLVIGTANNHGCDDIHLHLDFSWITSGYDAVKGSYNDETKVFTLEDGSSYNLVSNIDTSLLNNLKSVNAEGDEVGYCWLVFCSDQVDITATVSSTYDSRVDCSSILNADSNGWYAAYGMLTYEFGGLPDSIATRGIKEYIARSFRSRLIGGASISGICEWDSGLPGYNKAVSMGKNASTDIKTIVDDVLSGKNYFNTEKAVEEINGWYSGGYSNDRLELYLQLYTGGCFYGGKTSGSPRWPSQTAAIIQYLRSDGNYNNFYFEGADPSSSAKKTADMLGSSPYPNKILT